MAKQRENSAFPGFMWSFTSAARHAVGEVGKQMRRRIEGRRDETRWGTARQSWSIRTSRVDGRGAGREVGGETAMRKKE